jgi:hypothetical protein
METLGLFGGFIALCVGIIWLAAMFSVMSIKRDVRVLTLEVQRVRYALVVAHGLKETHRPDGSIVIEKSSP